MSLFTPEQRRALPNALAADDETRAAKIGELYRADGAVAELLMNLGEDPVTDTTPVGMPRVLG